MEQIKENVRKGQFGFTIHATDERLRKNLSTDQIREVILKGEVAKKERDEDTDGRLIKYTIDWRDIRVVVKNDTPPLIISCRVKD